MNNMMKKIKNIMTIESAIKVIIILLLCYQLYDYTTQYLEYKTVVRMELKPFIGGQMPSLTLCSRDHGWMFVGKRINITDRGRINHLLRYEFVHLNNSLESRYEYKESSWTLDVSYKNMYYNGYLPVFEDNDYYNSMTDLHFSNISSYKCLTLFSKIQLKNKIKYDKHMKKKEINLEMKIEAPITIMEFRGIRNLSFYFKVHSSDSIISSIPWENHLMNNRRYKYDLLSTTRHLLPPPYHTNCYDYDQDLMKGNINQSNIARQFCVIEMFELKLFEYSKEKKVTCLCLYRAFHDEHFYHLPALNIIDYLSSVGGAFTLWIGISVLSFSVGIEKKLAPLIKTSLFILSMKCLKVIVYLICLIFTIIQIYISSKQYLNYDYVVRIRPDVQLIFPTIEAISMNAIDLNHDLISNSSLLKKKSADKFVNHSFNSFKLNCVIIANNDMLTSRDCGSFDNGVSYFEKIDENHIERIFIPRKNKVKNSTFSSDFNSNPIMIFKYTFNRKLIDSVVLHLNLQFIIQNWVPAMISHTYSFTQRSINLLPQPFETNCVEYQYSNSHYACFLDCVNQATFAQLQCKLYATEKSIFDNSIDWCYDKLRLNRSRYDKIYPILTKNCNHICSLECESNMYEYQSINQSFIESNESTIKLFPSEKPHIKYIYLAKMDFNQLIYEIGGIIGLWFGSSAHSLINLFIALWKKMISKIFRDFLRDLIRRNKVDCMEMNEYMKQSSIETNLKRRKNRRRNTI